MRSGSHCSSHRAGVKACNDDPSAASALLSICLRFLLAEDGICIGTQLDVSLPLVTDVLPYCKIQGNDYQPQDLRGFQWRLLPSHIFFQGVCVARIGAETSMHFEILREVGMSMLWAATSFMEAEGNARSQDKSGIVPWSILQNARHMAMLEARAC